MTVTLRFTLSVDSWLMNAELHPLYRDSPGNHGKILHVLVKVFQLGATVLRGITLIVSITFS
jgi:hypothetical protein